MNAYSSVTHAKHETHVKTAMHSEVITAIITDMARVNE